MGILSVLVLLCGAFLSGAVLQDGARQDPVSPELHAVWQDPGPAQGAGDFDPSGGLDCRAHRPRVIYRDLSRTPGHETGSAAPVRVCTGACTHD